MPLESISTPETAVERIRKLSMRIQQDIARYNLGEARQDVNTFEELCSFLYSYKEIAKNKAARNIPLNEFERNLLFNVDLEQCIIDYLPTLKWTIDRIYPDINLYDYKIPFVKNLKQRDCLELFWKIVDSLGLGTPEQASVSEHETIFTELE